MKAGKTFKWIGVGAAALGVVVVIAALSISSETYAHYVEQKFIESARESNILLDFSSSDLFYSGFRSSGIKAFFPQAYTALMVDNAELTVPVASILRGRPQVTAHGSAYEGTITGSGEFRLGGNEARWSFDLEQLKFFQHPHARLIGLTDGLLTLRVPELAIDADGRASGRIQLQLEQVQKPERTTLPTFLTRLPLAITIPALTDGRLSMEASFDPTLVTLSQFLLRSSLGKITSRGTLRLLDGHPLSIDVSIKVKLTDTGVTELGPWVELASRGNIPHTKNRFMVQIQGSVQRPQVRFHAR